jgi:hypothetical protein
MVPNENQNYSMYTLNLEDEKYWHKQYTCPPDANRGDPNSNTLPMSKL